LVNVAPSKASGLFPKPAVTLQIPSQIAPMVSSLFIYFLLLINAENIFVLSMCLFKSQFVFVVVQWLIFLFECNFNIPLLFSLVVSYIAIWLLTFRRDFNFTFVSILFLYLKIAFL
jgi:hypothetical protein